MSKTKINPRNLVLFLFIILMVAIRVIGPFMKDFSLIANFTMVGAVSLFGGAYFNSNVKAFGLPVLTLFISDILLNIFVYKSDTLLYDGWYWTYIAFALMVLTGKLMLRKVNAAGFLGAALVIVFIHWIVSDFGVWLGSVTYPQTLYGFWLCLYAAIPFERTFLYGSLIYGSIMFGSFEYLKVKYPSLRLNRPVTA